MLARPALTTALAFVLTLTPPAGLRAQRPADPVRDALESALAAWRRGDDIRTLEQIERARDALRPTDFRLPAGVQANLAELEEVLAIYRLYAHGRRPDHDAVFVAVTGSLAGIRQAYRERGRSAIHRQIRSGFDLDGRVIALGELDVAYHPFSGRIASLGDIEIDYVPFSDHPRRIGSIEFRWFFDELHEVAGVRVDRD